MRRGLVVLAAVLIAGCSKGATVSPTMPSSSPASATTVSKPQTTTTTTTTPIDLPTPATGAAYDAVAQWISKGAPMQADNYHSAVRDGQTNNLGQDVAFTTPSGKTKCTTFAEFFPGTLQCLAKLTNPPPRPSDAEGEWIGGWIDFNDKHVTVGGLHGDAGRFTEGDGRTLDYGAKLTFGDFECRPDTSGLFCADTKAKTAVRVSDAGVEPFGCLRKVAPSSKEIGWEFSC